MQALLHNYLAVNDISESKIYGLAGLSFTNQLNVDGGLQKEVEDIVTVQKEMDIIYHDVQSAVSLLQPDDSSPFPRKLKIEPAAFNSMGETYYADVVAWNPWIDKSKSISDMEDDGYRRFVCIEPGLVRSPVRVPVGQSITLAQTINAC